MIESINVPVSDLSSKDDRIRVLAYSLWEEDGCPDGCADDHWHRAVATIEAELAVQLVREPTWLKREEAAEAPAASTGETARSAKPGRGARAA